MPQEILQIQIHCLDLQFLVECNLSNMPQQYLYKKDTNEWIRRLFTHTKIEFVDLICSYGSLPEPHCEVAADVIVLDDCN